MPKKINNFLKSGFEVRMVDWLYLNSHRGRLPSRFLVGNLAINDVVYILSLRIR